MIIPKHIAFVMDGNGRWALNRGLSRSAGHKAGYEHIPDVLEICRDLGVEVVSGFAWSTENWGRPKPEVNYIMQNLEKHLLRFVKELHQRDVRFVHSGTSDKLTTEARQVIQEAMELTQDNDNGVFNLAFNYGGRAEIVQAIRKLIEKQVPAEEVSEAALSEYLWTAGLPDVDLVIRSGGDKRLSNFLLWQSAYAWVYVVDAYWPEIARQDIEAGIRYYSQMRNRVAQHGMKPTPLRGGCIGSRFAFAGWSE